MTPILGGEEALGRLQAILNGSTVVESDLFPRLVQALVRLTGARGEAVFRERLLSEKSPLMAALLARASISVLGHRAVDDLVKGALTGVNLERVRASTEVLAQLGTVEAHDALAKLTRELRHPVAREMAASRLDEMEDAFPARYRLIPLLRTLDKQDPEAILSRFGAMEDREATPLLLQAFPELPLKGRILACRLLEKIGDARAGNVLHERLSQGVEPELFDPLFRCLREILTRHPDAALEGGDRWSELWKHYGDREEAAHAVAIALTLKPLAKHLPLYREFIESPLEAVRTAGLNALAAVPDPSLGDRIKACFAEGSLRERVAVLRALAALGMAPDLFKTSAASPDPEIRQAAAVVALELGQKEAWAALAVDPDEAVVKAAFDTVTRVPADKRPSPRELEKILLAAERQKVFEGACQAIGLSGDRDSAKQISAVLVRPESWVREPVTRSLRALRGRGVFRWENLDPPSRKRVIDAIGAALDPAALSLLGSFLDDFPLEDLQELKRRLFSKTLPSHGPAQAMLMAMVGRTHILETRAKALAVLDETMGVATPPPARQVETLQRIAGLWLRGDIDLGSEVSEKFERKLSEAAENKSLSPPARCIALECLGRAGSAQALPVLKRLRSHPTEQISACAEIALETFLRRHPTLSLEEKPASTRSVSENPATILVVEDDANTRKIYMDFLAQRGYRTMGATDGNEALRHLRGTGVDVVLLDLQMEGMDGYTFLEKTAALAHRPPILVITGVSDRNSVVRVLRLGAKDFLRKPIDLNQLQARVERVLE